MALFPSAKHNVTSKHGEKLLVEFCNLHLGVNVFVNDKQYAFIYLPLDKVDQLKVLEHIKQEKSFDEQVKKLNEDDFKKVLCVQCGERVESNRECYAHPTCYACLPPPPSLPILWVQKEREQ